MTFARTERRDVFDAAMAAMQLVLLHTCTQTAAVLVFSITIPASRRTYALDRAWPLRPSVMAAVEPCSFLPAFPLIPVYVVHCIDAGGSLRELLSLGDIHWLNWLVASF